jgi:hypothetical protein
VSTRMVSDERSLQPRLTLWGWSESKFEQAARLALARCGGRWVPLHMITEFPKSGGTWLAQMVAEYLGIPFPRNRPPGFRECVLHGHFRPHPSFNSLRRVLWLVRDGRDVLVSLYHHYLVWNDRTRMFPKETLYYRSRLQFKDYLDVRSNLPVFIEYMFTHVPSRLHQFTHPGNWASFNSAWFAQRALSSRRLAQVRYEDLLGGRVDALACALAETGECEVDTGRLSAVAEHHRFERQTQRANGQEDKASFLRKGVSGDWRNHFTPTTAQVFDHYAGAVLIALGYESDHGWVHSVL